MLTAVAAKAINDVTSCATQHRDMEFMIHWIIDDMIATGLRDLSWIKFNLDKAAVTSAEMRITTTATTTTITVVTSNMSEEVNATKGNTATAMKLEQMMMLMTEINDM